MLQYHQTATCIKEGGKLMYYQSDRYQENVGNGSDIYPKCHRCHGTFKKEHLAKVLGQHNSN